MGLIMNTIMVMPITIGATYKMSDPNCCRPERPWPTIEMLLVMCQKTNIPMSPIRSM